MRRTRRPRKSRRPPPLSEEQILAWADAFHDRHGRWPKKDDGPIEGTLQEKWLNVDMALRLGLRGLPGGSSLARLLAEKRWVRNHMALPRLSREQILAWADAHHTRIGSWPNRGSGPVVGAPGETWLALDVALMQGHRGLPGGSSLARLLEEERGVRNRATVPPLTAELMLAWADAHHRRTGKWPNRTSGAIAEAPGETWLAVHTALRNGQRSLAGGSSLAQFLNEHRDVRNHKRLPPLTAKQILAWASAHHRRTGRWPSRYSGPVEGSDGETWAGINTALEKGQRGFPGGSSLPRLLTEAGLRGRPPAAPGR
jgi:hypothetical protein